jgi:3-methyladenine DNA glycosylase AlkC
MVNWIKNYTGQNVYSSDRQELNRLKKDIERYKKKQIKQEMEDISDKNSSDVNIII